MQQQMSQHQNQPKQAPAAANKFGPIMQPEKQAGFIGKTFEGNTGNKYLITNKIKSGGMGVVYKAASGSHTVAVKVFGKDILTADNTDVKRFRQEASIMEKINHPNVVRLLDFGTSETYLFLVMEYLKGKSLHDIFAPGTENENLTKPVTPAKWDFARSVILQALAGIQAAHTLGIWHRDIKPGNIIVLESGQVKLIDFGTAKTTQFGTSTITQTGVAVGTFHFMAPETIELKHPDHRVDIYGAGAVLYWLLSGTLPFTGNNIRALAQAICGETSAMPLSKLVPGRGIPDQLDEIVLCALAKDRKDRFHSAGEMADAIKKIDWDGQPNTSMAFAGFTPRRSLARRIASVAFKIVLPLAIATGAILAAIYPNKATSIYKNDVAPFYNSRIAPALKGLGISFQLPGAGTAETITTQKPAQVPARHYVPAKKRQLPSEQIQYFPLDSAETDTLEIIDTLSDY